jgi:hypothetical protein
MKGLSSFFQFVLGFFLGIALLLGGTAALGYIVFTRMAASPEKPVFAEEKEKTKEVSDKKPVEPPKTEVSPSPTPQESPEAEKEDLPAGAYKARVTWSDGLSLRGNPSTDAERVGGLGYNARVIILATEGQWQKVRIPSSGQEGWIKAGNVEKIEE